jgi:hypothetical protein
MLLSVRFLFCKKTLQQPGEKFHGKKVATNPSQKFLLFIFLFSDPRFKLELVW